MMWVVVVTVFLQGHQPLEFKSKQYIYATEEECSANVMRAAAEFVADAKKRKAPSFNFKVECRQDGTPA